MRWPRLRVPSAVEVAPGERVLATATTSDGAVLAATREAFYLPGGVRLGWEQIEAADWDRDTDTLRVSEVGTYGEQRAEHAFVMPAPGRLLPLVRERVTASVVVWRSVPVGPRAAVKVIGRRPPGSAAAPIAWVYEYDEGVDPADPRVQLAAAETLQALRHEVGEL